MTSEEVQVEKIYHPNGTLHAEWSRLGGKMEGVQRMWYDNGHLFAEATFRNGLAEGLVREWTRDGQLTLEANMVGGVYSGRYRRWWDDGTPECDGVMALDKRQPGFIDYNEDGSVRHVRS
jgi:antitoxin component YwqK of YwqJK toxin-antitoxin module